MIQLNQMQLISQTPSQVEITKMLSTSQCESRIIDCYCRELISEEEIGY